MEELIKYFETIETRLSAIEAAAANEAKQEARIAALEAQVARIAALEAQVAAQHAQLMEMQSLTEALQEQLDAAMMVAATGPVEVPTAEAEQEEAIDESEEIKTDEETGLPELEVEFIDKEEEVPELEIPLLEILTDEPEEEEPAVPIESPVVTKQAVVEQPAAKIVAPEASPIVVPAAAVTTTSTAAPSVAAVAAKAVKADTAPVTTAAEPISSVVPKLEDIRKGITMGDRFLFQRELFSNSGELMNKTIDKLNKMGSYDEAMTFVQNQFAGWNKESNAYELFINLLKRRW